jgi:glycosyltransferase involved in cell wall biosynthesis
MIRPILKSTLIKADKVISVCKALKDEMVSLGISKNKIQVVSNGVDSGKFYIIKKRNARKQLDLPMDYKVILSVGSLIPRKGFDLLIKAFRKVLDQQHNKVLLIIIGEGPLRSELETLVETNHLTHNVIFAGKQQHNQLNIWYNSADLFVLCSDREGWPNVLMESIACGVPIVATNVWGIPEIITSTEIGLLAKREIYDIVAKICYALNKKWNRDFIRGHGSQQSWEQKAESLLHLFKATIV